MVRGVEADRDRVKHGRVTDPVLEPDGLDRGDLRHEGVDRVEDGDPQGNHLGLGVDHPVSLGDNMGDVDHFVCVVKLSDVGLFVL